MLTYVAAQSFLTRGALAARHAPDPGTAAEPVLRTTA